MKLLSTNFDIHPENYNEITPRGLKITADVILFITMFLDFITPWLDKMPEISEKIWIIWIISGLALLFKFITKMITEKQV